MAGTVPVILGLVSSPTASAARTTLCTGYGVCAAAGYSNFGYAAKSGVSYWGMYPGYNCTNYAAFRLISNGVNASYLRGQGNAYQWGSVARSRGVPVDGSPRVGEIAWWDSQAGLGADGHVAYVEQVGNDHVVVSQDVYGGDFSWARLTPGSPYPTAFIHFDGTRNLFFIKTKNTSGGKVEVHTATAASGYRGSDLHAETWLGTGDQSNGWFQIS